MIESSGVCCGAVAAMSGVVGDCFRFLTVSRRCGRVLAGTAAALGGGPLGRGERRLDDGPVRWMW